MAGKADLISPKEQNANFEAYIRIFIRGIAQRSAIEVYQLMKEHFTSYDQTNYLRMAEMIEKYRESVISEVKSALTHTPHLAVAENNSSVGNVHKCAAIAQMLADDAGSDAAARLNQLLVSDVIELRESISTLLANGLPPKQSLEEIVNAFFDSDGYNAAETDVQALKKGSGVRPN